jgi:hypothetical protein
MVGSYHRAAAEAITQYGGYIAPIDPRIAIHSEIFVLLF